MKIAMLVQWRKNKLVMSWVQERTDSCQDEFFLSFIKQLKIAFCGGKQNKTQSKTEQQKLTKKAFSLKKKKKQQQLWYQFILGEDAEKVHF